MEGSDLIIHNLQVKANELILEKSNICSSDSLDEAFDNPCNTCNGVLSEHLVRSQYLELQEINENRIQEIEYSLKAISIAIEDIKNKDAIKHAMSLISNKD